MSNLTPDGKIKTIRCVKATHEDFAKLVKLGKDVKQELKDMETNTNTTLKELGQLLMKEDGNHPWADSGKTVLELYTWFVQKQAELDAYRNTYHVLMEEGVDELLASIDVGPESYDYDFYELCLDC